MGQSADRGRCLRAVCGLDSQECRTLEICFGFSRGKNFCFDGILPAFIWKSIWNLGIQYSLCENFRSTIVSCSCNEL